MRLRIAARGSRLSLIQVGLFVERLLDQHPHLGVNIRTIRTLGDRYGNKPFTSIGARGVFEKEVNQAVLRGEADLAVHSLKDVPSTIDPRLILVAVLPRDPPYDALVTKTEITSIDDLPRKAVIGTSSARRRAMLLHYRKDLRIRPLRGNLDTRLRKLEEGKYDAIIVAEAGLRRLGVSHPYLRLPPSLVTPAPGQGIIAVYARRGDPSARIASSTNHPETMIEARAERACLACMKGGCNVPAGCLARLQDGRLVVQASLLDSEGRWRKDVLISGDPSSPEELGAKAAKMLAE